MFWNSSEAKHKIVVIGDSIAQGFQNGGIYRTDLGFPAFLNRCFEPEPPMDLPLFTAQGGIPINLEILVRGLSDEFGSSLEWKEYLPAATHIYRTLRRIKKYWEGKLRPLKRAQETPYHNQAVWGFAMNDTWMMTSEKAKEYIQTQEETYSVFDILPDHAMYVTACLVLNPNFDEDYASCSQINNVKYLHENGGIDNLIVSAGHNNIIGAVTDLRFKYSEPEELHALPGRRSYTVYRPEHFEQEFRALAERVSTIGANRVITQTIPYVTIPPVARGVNADLSRGEGGYFDYYTRFWIWDSDFNPDVHPHLTREQAIELDQNVDEYNTIIRQVAREYGWMVVPLNKYVSAVARRRLGGRIKVPYPTEFREAMMRNPNTEHLLEDPDNPILGTNYIKLDSETGKVRKGGIFSLDGIHPTTIGYGLIAHLYYETMKSNGVKFDKPLDWDYIIENDTLVTDPPRLLIDLKDILRFLSLGRREKLNKIGEGLLSDVMRVISPRPREPAQEA